MKQHHITRFYLIAAVNQIGDGQPLEHGGRGNIRDDCIRYPDHHCRSNDTVRRIGTVRLSVGNPITNGNPVNALTNRLGAEAYMDVDVTDRKDATIRFHAVPYGLVFSSARCHRVPFRSVPFRILFTLR